MVRPKEADSIRQQVCNIWVENQHLTAKKICSQLGLVYKIHGNYVNKLLSKFRTYYNLGYPLKSHSLHRRVFVWENVSRELLPKNLQQGFHEWKGWRLSRNNNGMLVFKNELGSVHWYVGGKVRLYLKGDLKLARVKGLFCKAFDWLDTKKLFAFLDVPLRMEGRHWVFDVGKPVPRFDISKFRRSHGIRICSDGSHPNAVEVEENVPFWVKDLKENINKLSESLREFIAVKSSFCVESESDFSEKKFLRDINEKEN